MTKTVIRTETFEDAYRFMDNAFASPHIEDIEFENCTFNLEFFVVYFTDRDTNIKNCNFRNCKLNLTPLKIVGGSTAIRNLIFKKCEFSDCNFDSKNTTQQRLQIHKYNFKYDECKFTKCNMSNHCHVFDISRSEMNECKFNECKFLVDNGCRIAESTLTDIDFSDAQINIDFHKSKLNGCKFTNAKLRKCIFGDNNFLNRDTSETTLKECIFERASVNACRFRKVKLNAVVLNDVTFVGENNFDNTKFENSPLHVVDSLTNVKFHACTIVLDTTKLRDAFRPEEGGYMYEMRWMEFFRKTEFMSSTFPGDMDMSGLYFENTVFDSCIMAGINMSNTYLREVTFTKTNLSNVNFQGAINICSGCNFTRETYDMGRDFNSSGFKECMLDNVDFTNAILSSVSFRGADLFGSNFTGAKLNNSDFRYINSVININNPTPEEEQVPFIFNGADLTNAIFDSTDLRKMIFDDNTIFTGAKIPDIQVNDDAVLQQLIARGADNTPPPRPQQTRQQTQILGVRAPDQLATRQGGTAFEVHTGFKTFSFQKFIDIVTPVIETVKLADNEKSYNTIMTNINANKPTENIVGSILDLAKDLAKKFISSGVKNLDTVKQVKINSLEVAINKGRGSRKPFEPEQLTCLLMALKYVYTKAKTFPEFVEAYIDAFISDTQGAYRETNKVTVDIKTEEGKKDTLSCEAGIVERVLLSMTNVFLLCKDDGYTKYKAKCNLYPEMEKLHKLFNRADLIENIRTFIGQYKDEWRNEYMRSILDKPEELADQYGKFIAEIEDEETKKALKEQLKQFVDDKLKQLLTTDNLSKINAKTFIEEYRQFMNSIGAVQLAFNLDTPFKKISTHIGFLTDLKALVDQYDVYKTGNKTDTKAISELKRKLDHVKPRLDTIMYLYNVDQPVPVEDTKLPKVGLKYNKEGDDFSEEALLFNLEAICTHIRPYLEENKATLADKYGYAITEATKALRTLLGKDQNYTIPEPILEDIEGSFANLKPKTKPATPAVNTTPVIAPKPNSNKTKKRSGSNSSNRAPATVP